MTQNPQQAWHEGMDILVTKDEEDPRGLITREEYEDVKLERDVAFDERTALKREVDVLIRLVDELAWEWERHKLAIKGQIHRIKALG